jgi:tripeptidyl-peptidase-2
MDTIQLQIEDLQDQLIKCKKDTTTTTNDTVVPTKQQLTEQIQDKKVLLKELQSQIDSFPDNNVCPWLDIVVMESTPKDFRVVVDVNATGNLTTAIPMAPFAQQRQIGTLGFGSFTNFCIQIYDEGKTISIVTDAGSHGTHVAGIAAAYFPPSNNGNDTTNCTNNNSNNNNNNMLVDRNGVAPGAQILACKIGDGRLGSAETGTGLIRALIAAKKYGCDLINLSYGEPSWQPDSGRVAETFADAVYKWGMTVFTSAGNDGPALSSLGSPGTLTAPITVGALVSPEMLVDQYSTLPSTDDEAPLLDASYHFSSRGPTPDGAMPDLCAPGGAIAPVPQHTLQGKAQYHGTSMASPNACGVAACVLSALRQQGLSSRISPVELKRGLINSAKQVDISDPYAQGGGLISATAAVSYMLQHHGKDGQDLFFDIHITNRNNARGIYIRDALELQGPLTFNVNVKPRFEHATDRSPEELASLLSLELDLLLTPSESWITCPERMTLFSGQDRGGQSFSVRLAKVMDLKPGAHFATVDALDANDPTRGPLFQVPVTVIIPHSFAVNKAIPLENLSMDESIVLQDNQLDITTTFRLLPGAPNRRFLSVPSQAEWATIKVKSLSPDASETSPQRILMHAIPFARGDLPNGMIQLKKLMVLTGKGSNECMSKSGRKRGSYV